MMMRTLPLDDQMQEQTNEGRVLYTFVTECEIDCGKNISFTKDEVIVGDSQ